MSKTVPLLPRLCLYVILWGDLCLYIFIHVHSFFIQELNSSFACYWTPTGMYEYLASSLPKQTTSFIHHLLK